MKLASTLGAKLSAISVKEPFPYSAISEMQPVPPQEFYDAQERIAAERVKSVMDAAQAAGAKCTGHTVEAAKAEGSKESRATPYSAEQNKGNVWIPKDGTVDWDVKAFVDEHRKMMGDGRKPAHDDQIDTAAYGMLEFIGFESSDIFIPSTDLAGGGSGRGPGRGRSPGRPGPGRAAARAASAAG